MEEIKKYDIVFKDKGYRSRESSQGLHCVDKLCEKYKFQTVMDVGCGPGWSVVAFLMRGKMCQGVESCKYLFDNELRILAGSEIVKQASIVDIPCPVSSFDMVFCTDVLEHVQEKNVDKAISELVRISKKYIFCTISSWKAQMFPELELHQTVKPREWWEEKFSHYKLKKLDSSGMEVSGGPAFTYMYQRLP